MRYDVKLLVKYAPGCIGIGSYYADNAPRGMRPATYRRVRNVPSSIISYLVRNNFAFTIGVGGFRQGKTIMIQDCPRIIFVFLKDPRGGEENRRSNHALIKKLKAEK